MSGVMPKELAALAEPCFKAAAATSDEFLAAIAARL
jgi:hypothetical protein